MDSTLRLMCILAHPNDETLAAGGILARYAAEGIATSLICATRGENANPEPPALGRIREMELVRASQILGVHQAHILNFLDGELDQIDPGVIVPQIAALLRRIRPQVVVTFDPNGAYGHPDTIAICQFTHSALVLAADNCANLDGTPHQILKLYYLAETRESREIHRSIFGDVRMQVDGIERQTIPWEEWAITTRVDTSLFRDIVWQAAACYRSQIPATESFRQAAAQSRLWHTQTLFRAMSLVNSGRESEDDLFAGIRGAVRPAQPPLLRTPCQPMAFA